MDEMAEKAAAMLSPCRVCPRQCRVRRYEGQTGFCRTAARPLVSSTGAHFGEEAVLVGPGGSGTIFFCGCNLDCVYCQNCEISHEPGGLPVTPAQLAGLMVSLERRGCGNVNLVSPTHVAPQVLEALGLARGAGLAVPVIFNCGGYESLEMLALLAGAIDIYMPDFKYGTNLSARKYSGVSDYVEVASAALAEMYRQVGPLVLGDDGLAKRGVLVRHLVLPVDLAESRKVIDRVAKAAPGCAINVMEQYRPCYRAAEFPELLLLPRRTDVRGLREYAAAKGLVRVDGGEPALSKPAPATKPAVRPPLNTPARPSAKAAAKLTARPARRRRAQG